MQSTALLNLHFWVLQIAPFAYDQLDHFAADICYLAINQTFPHAYGSLVVLYHTL